MAQRIKPFLLNNAPLLTTIAVFIFVYLLGGWLYPAMQKPQVFFNLFINTASLLIVSIGMTFVIITKGIDLSVAGICRSSGKRCQPCDGDTFDVADGYRVWVYVGLYYPFLESGALYRDLDGSVFCPWYGLCHHP